MIHWDPNPDLLIIPYLHWPIKWYGLFFALGFILGFTLFKNVILRFLRYHFESESLVSLKLRAHQIADQMTLYVVIATIAGARIGHELFYESPQNLLRQPWTILQVWNGGLASHGAAAAILLAIYFLSRKPMIQEAKLSYLRLLDFICPSVALAGAIIRLGNFMNQEILGTPTQMAWGVCFGHPADGMSFGARHPVQIYEAIFYLAVFLILWRRSSHPTLFNPVGREIGLFLMLVFGFRIAIEFLKLEQSALLAPHFFTMGQYLSLPLFLLGLLLFWNSKYLKINILT